MAFQNVVIASLRNGGTPINGARQDLVGGEVVTLSLSDYTGVTSRRWELRGRPEGATAGGGGTNPWVLGTGTTATFTVSSDAGAVHLDGTYVVACVLNAGSPTETHITTVVARTTGLTVAGLSGALPLRKLGGFESLEDSLSPGGGVVTGWATMLNRWLEYIRGVTLAGSSTLRVAYETGTSGTDQTLPLTNAKGGLTVDGSAGGASGLTYALSILGQSGTAVRIGVAAAYLTASGGLGTGAVPSAPNVLAMGDGASAAVSAASTGQVRYNHAQLRLEFSVNGGAWTAFGTGGGGGGSTLRAAYQAGSSSTDQTLPLLDSDGGGIILDGTSASFTGTHVLDVRGNQSRGLRVRRDTGRVVIDAVESTTTAPTKTFTIVDSGNVGRYPTMQFKDNDDGVWDYNVEYQGDVASLSTLYLSNPTTTRANRIAMLGLQTGSGIGNQFLLQHNSTVIGGLENYRTGLTNSSPFQQDSLVIRCATTQGLHLVNDISGATMRFWIGGRRVGTLISTAQAAPLTGFNETFVVGPSSPAIGAPPATTGTSIVVRNLADTGVGQGTSIASQFINGGQVWQLYSPSAAVAADAGKTWEFVYNGNHGATTTLTGQRLFILNPETAQLPAGIQITDQQAISLTANQNNYSPDGLCVFNLNPTAARTITGFVFTGVGNVAGRVLVINNTSTSNTIVLSHLSGSSTAPNQFVNPGSVDITLLAGGSASYLYDIASTKWRCISFTAATSGGGGGGGGTLRADYIAGTTASDQTLPLTDVDGGGIIVDGSAVGFTGTFTLDVRGNNNRGLRVRRDTGRVVVDAVESNTTVPNRTFTVVDDGNSGRFPTIQWLDNQDGAIPYDVLLDGEDDAALGLPVLQMFQPNSAQVNRVAMVSGRTTGLANELAFRNGITHLGQLRAYGTSGSPVYGAPGDPYDVALRSDRRLTLVSGMGGGSSGAIDVFGGDTANGKIASFAKTTSQHVFFVTQPDAASTLIRSNLGAFNGAVGISGAGSSLQVGFLGVGHVWNLFTADAATAAAAGATLRLQDNGIDVARIARTAQTTSGNSHDFTVTNDIASGATHGSAMVAVLANNPGNTEGHSNRNPRLRVGFSGSGNFWTFAPINDSVVANAGKLLSFSQTVGGALARPLALHPNYLMIGQGLRTSQFIGTSALTIAADQNNFVPSLPGDPGGPGCALTFMLTPTGANRTITGWRVDGAVANSSLTEGVVLKIINASSTLNLTLAHESGSSDAVNQFRLPGNVDLVLPPRGSVTLWYESQVANRWYTWGGVGLPAGSGSGGGPAIPLGQVAVGNGTSISSSIYFTFDATGTRNLNVNAATSQFYNTGECAMFVTDNSGSASATGPSFTLTKFDGGNAGGLGGPRSVFSISDGYTWSMQARNAATGPGEVFSFSQSDGSTADQTLDVLQFLGDPAGAGGPPVLGLSAGVASLTTLGPASLSTNQNDYNPGDRGITNYRLTSSVPVNITGWLNDISGNDNGIIITIHNIGTNVITLKNNSTSSTTTNRFKLAADYAIGADCSVSLWFDPITTRWRLAGTQASPVPYDWGAQEMLFPATSDAATSTPATLESLAGNEEIDVIGFSDSTDQGVKYPRRPIPPGTTQVKVRFHCRPKVAPASTSLDDVVLTLASRKVTTGGAVGAWQYDDLPQMSFGGTTTNWADFEEPILFSAFPTVIPAPGEHWQFSINRKTSSGSDTLVDKLYISEFGMVYS